VGNQSGRHGQALDDMAWLRIILDSRCQRERGKSPIRRVECRCEAFVGYECHWCPSGHPILYFMSDSERCQRLTGTDCLVDHLNLLFVCLYALYGVKECDYWHL